MHKLGAQYLLLFFIFILLMIAKPATAASGFSGAALGSQALSGLSQSSAEANAPPQSRDEVERELREMAKKAEHEAKRAEERRSQEVPELRKRARILKEIYNEYKSGSAK